jgi:hypothetical protein
MIIEFSYLPVNSSVLINEVLFFVLPPFLIVPCIELLMELDNLLFFLSQGCGAEDRQEIDVRNEVEKDLDVKIFIV